MRDTLRRICELQPLYTSQNTSEMQERGKLIRNVLATELRQLQPVLSAALGPYGADFHVDGSDGITNKTELPWTRFCSAKQSPSATVGFYVVLHFSTDGTGVNVVVGCSSSRFEDGYAKRLPRNEVIDRSAWVRRVVADARGTLDPFVDGNDFGASYPLPKSFQDASALVKKIPYDEIEDQLMINTLTTAAEMLRVVYDAQREGRELSPADQVELDIMGISRPQSKDATGQGYGLTAAERKAVELRAMTLAEEWLSKEGYALKDTSKNKPYDFSARKGEDELFVEVKGTTSENAYAIAMTHGEVALHRNNKGQTALIIVTGIRLHKDGKNPKAFGGALEALVGWDIDDWSLDPTAFRVSRKH